MKRILDVPAWATHFSDGQGMLQKLEAIAPPENHEVGKLCTEFASALGDEYGTAEAFQAWCYVLGRWIRQQKNRTRAYERAVELIKVARDIDE